MKGEFKYNMPKPEKPDVRIVEKYKHILPNAIKTVETIGRIIIFKKPVYIINLLPIQTYIQINSFNYEIWSHKRMDLSTYWIHESELDMIIKDENLMIQE